MQPTLCSRCHKNVAVIFIQKMEGGTTKSEGLCLKCAKEMGIKPVEDMMQKMGISDEDLEGLTNEMMSAFGGAEGMAKMQSLMDGLRADAPKAIAGLAVESVVDYEQDGTGLPKANVLEYRLAGGEKFIVRPSGTEPKIKTYLSALAPTAAEAAQEEANLKAAAEEMMK